MNQKFVKIILLIIGFIAMVTTVTVAMILNKDTEDVIIPDPTTTITTIKLPDNYANVNHPIYTPTGRIAFSCNDKNAPESDNHIFVVIDEDGTNPNIIYKGEVEPIYHGNGMRIMPFPDNKRLLLGDYIMECPTDLDHCENKAVLVPIEYPQKLVNDSRTMNLWSEIIIAPDNEHMAWTTLHTSTGAVNFIAKLEKVTTTSSDNTLSNIKNINSNDSGKYILNNVKIISGLAYFQTDPNNSSNLISPDYIRGGEIKQFTNGGEKVTLAGAGKRGLAKSVLQDLYTNLVVPLSHEPGYDETTIISPDGKLGIVMSTRFSPKTNCAILGLLDRPNSAFPIMGIIRYVYEYAVTKVRTTRIGNVGPALIDIEKSINDKHYHGIDLHDPSQDWVYHSPMSWHPSSTKAIWPEKNRKNGENRIQKVILENYPTGKSFEPKKIDIDKIPYALDISALDNVPPMFVKGNFIGKTGHMFFDYAIDLQTYKQSSLAEYVNFSEDGETFTNGKERFWINATNGEINYEGKVKLSGKETGEMDFKITISSDNRVLFEKDDEGKPKSYGYSTYDGKTINVSDMSE